MGASSSSEAYNADSTLMKYYGAVLIRMKARPSSFKGGAITGGCNCITGAGDLQNYENSVYSHAKEKLIRGIAAETFAALRGKSALDFNKAPLDKVIAQLSGLVPNPKKGTSLIADKDVHEDVIIALVKAINKIYGSAIVDPEASIGIQAGKCYEIIHSLVRDVNSEFMNVAGDVERSVRNLHTLREYLLSTHARIMEVVGKSGDATIQQQAAAVDEFYKALVQELDRQLVILGNLVGGVIGPTKQSLIELLEDNESFNGFVQKIKAAVGTTEFGSRLSYLLAGVDVLAQVAGRVEKALKAIGMTTKEYADAANMNELRTKMYKHIGTGKSATAKDIAQFIAATEVLRNADYAHDQIAEYLQKKGGEILGSWEATHGGADEVPEMFSSKMVSERTLGKRIEKQDKFRERLFADFYDNLLTAYRKIVAAVNAFGPKIGTSIPISDELEQFIRAFSQMDMADRENFHVVLSGWQRDVKSRDYKNRFMMALETTYHHLQNLRAVNKGSSDLAEIDSAISDLRRMVAEFNDKFLGAITEIALPRVDSSKGRGETVGAGPFDDLKRHAQASLDNVAHAVAHEVDGMVNHAIHEGTQLIGDQAGVLHDALHAAVKAKVTGSGESEYYASIKSAQRKLVTYFQNATITGDLARAAEDMKEYSTGYETLLGEAMGKFIDEIERAYDAELKGLNPDTNVNKDADSVGAIFKEFMEKKLDGTAPAADVAKARKAQVDKWTEMLKQYYEDKRNAKRDLVKVAQAIDLLLRAFTRAQAAHPDEVKDIASIFETVQATAKFFSDRSGNNIAALFEEFPSDIVGDQDITSKVSLDCLGNKYAVDSVYDTSKIYYEWLSERLTKGQLPGNPYYGKLLWKKEDYKTLKTMITKAIGGVRALENLVSVFVNAGSKFTGSALMKETFMERGHLIKILMDYWVMSVITMGTKSSSLLYSDTSNEKIPALGSGHFTTWTSGKDPKGRLGTLNEIPERKGLDLEITDDKVPDKMAFREDSALSSVYTGLVTVDRKDPTKTVISSTSTLNNIRRKITFAMNSSSSNATIFKNDYEKTDELFVMIIKSMAAKILVLTETYALYHKPTSSQTWSLTPFRMILGGAVSSEDVDVIDDAAELYIRLPLLGEWYRETLALPSIRKDIGENAFVISIVPDATSVWSDFLSIIFDRTDFIKEGTYSESDVRALIRAINKVYVAYKEKDARISTRNVINSLVTEINRRYGFVKREHLDTYYKKRRDNIDGTIASDMTERERVDYDILDSRNTWSARPAPSDSFASFRSFDPSVQQIWTKEVKATVDKFREKLTADMDSVTEKEMTRGGLYQANRLKHSFNEAIRNTRASLKVAKSSGDKFQIAMRAIQGINKFGGFRKEHALMFQEMVVFPLTSLYGLWIGLDSFNKLVQSTQFSKLEKSDTANLANDGKIADEYIKIKKDEAAAENVASTYFRENLTAFENAIKDYLNAGIGIGAHSSTEYNKSIKLKNLFDALVKGCYTVGTDLGKLCEFNFSNTGKVVLDISPLREHVSRILNNVKYALGVFRNIYGREFVELYETSDGKSVRSTYYDMEEHLFEILLRDRDKNGLPRAQEILSSTFGFIKKHTDSLQMTEVMDQLIYWRSTVGGSASRISYETSFPFNVVPKYDNGNNGIARTEEEKVLIRAFMDVKSDVTVNSSLSRYNTLLNQLTAFTTDNSPTAASMRSIIDNFFGAIVRNASLHADNLDPAKGLYDSKLVSSMPNVKTLYELIRNNMGKFNTMCNNAYKFIREELPNLRVSKKVGDYMLEFVVHMIRTRDVYMNTILTKTLAVNANTSIDGLADSIDIIVNLNDLIKQVGEVRKLKGIPSRTAAFAALQTDIGAGLNTRASIDALPPDSANDYVKNMFDISRLIGNPAIFNTFFAEYKAAENNALDKLRDITIPAEIATVSAIIDKAITDITFDEFKNIADSKTADVDDYKKFDKNAVLAIFQKRFKDANEQVPLIIPSVELNIVVYNNAAPSAEVDQRISDIANQRAFHTSAIAGDLPVGSFTTSYNYTDENSTEVGEIFRNLRFNVSDDSRTKKDSEEVKRLLKSQYASSVDIIDSIPVCMVVNESEPLRTDNVGLLVKFNQLLMQYLATFYDNASRKFYIPLINGFARNQSAAIMSGNAIPDMDVDASKLHDYNPPEGVVLFASVARAMKNLLNASNPQTGVKIFATDKLTDVADFVLENMRGNLPWFIRYFNEIRVQAEYLKKVVNDSTITFTDVTGTPLPGAGDYILGRKGLSVSMLQRSSGEKNRAYILMLDNIVSAVNSITTNATSVYKELVDVPLYLETSQNSIVEYRNRNGKLPLMPMSYMLYPLRGGNSGLLKPGNKAGSDVFKFNYGTRRLLTDVRDPFKLSYAPGLEAAIEAFNEMSPVDIKFEKGFVEQQMKDLLALQQWVLAGRYTKVWLNGSQPGNFDLNSLAGKVPNGSGGYVDKYSNFPLHYEPSPASSLTSLSQLLATIESNDTRRVSDEVLSKAVPGASDLSNEDDRAVWRKYNILDMNLVPINVHALMRDVPLINLINYSYTYGQMVDRFLRAKWRSNKAYDGKLIYPEDVVSKLINDPYCVIDGKEYYHLLQHAVVGDMGLNARRPKFISDQLWNKVLIGEQYIRAEVTTGDQSYGIDAIDRGGVEDDKKGWLVDPRGPAADAIIQRLMSNGPSSAADSVDAANVKGANRDRLTIPAYNESTGRNVTKAFNLGSVRKDGTNVHNMSKVIARTIGHVRSTTRLIRNMFLTSWIQFITAQMVTSRLEKIQSPVVDGTSLRDPRMVGYADNEQYDADDFV